MRTDLSAAASSRRAVHRSVVHDASRAGRTGIVGGGAWRVVRRVPGLVRSVAGIRWHCGGEIARWCGAGVHPGVPAWGTGRAPRERDGSGVASGYPCWTVLLPWRLADRAGRNRGRDSAAMLTEVRRPISLGPLPHLSTGAGRFQSRSRGPAGAASRCADWISWPSGASIGGEIVFSGGDQCKMRAV